METKYARLVANFETVTIVLSGLGASYNPVQELIKLPALLGKLEEAKAILVEVDNAQAEYAVAVDAGESLFKELRAYAVNIKRAAAVALNDDAFTSGLQAIINRIASKQGRVAVVASGVTGVAGAEPVALPKARSGPNAGRDAKTALLADMVALLRTRSDYQPEDAEFSIAGIEEKIAALNAANVRIREAASIRAAVAERRNAILFDETAGIARRVKLVKLQLARTPGTISAAFRRVSGIAVK